jgi:hypothetical protein
MQSDSGRQTSVDRQVIAGKQENAGSNSTWAKADAQAYIGRDKSK